MDFQPFLLGEIGAEEAGRLTGQVFGAVAFLAGAWKCWAISRRTTTNSKCALSLMFILLAWPIGMLTGLLMRWIGPSPFLAIMTALSVLVMIGLVVVAIVLAILGLKELSAQPGVFTQGRSQAIWALVLGGFMGLLLTGGMVTGLMRARGLALGRKTQPAKTATFEELNFRFEAPGQGWVSYDASKINKDSRVSFLKRFPETYFMIIAEKLGLGKEFSSQALAELGKAHLQAAASSSQVLSEEPFRLYGLDGVLVRTDAAVMGHQLHYLSWYLASNGYGYQLIGYGLQQDSKKVDAEVKKMFAHFTLLDSSRIARPGNAFRTNFISPHYHYQAGVANSAWGPWSSAGQSAQDAEFAASRGDSCFMVVPAWLGGEKPEPAALAYGLLAIMGIQYPDEKLSNRKSFSEEGGDALQFDFQREVSGNLFHYRLKIVQREGDGFLVAAWTQRNTDKDEILEDALSRVSFLPAAASLDSVSRGYTVREKKTQGFVLNHAGLFHFNSSEYEKALPLFCAAARASSSEPVYVLNAFQCWSHLDRPREALDFLKTQPETTLAVPDVRAWQAHFEKEANFTQEAVTHYSKLFGGGYRSDGHLAEYVHLLTLQRRDDEALSEVEKYLSKGDSVSARVLQAEIFGSKKDFSKALKLLKEQHGNAPFNLQVSRDLAETSLQAGLFSEALQIAREMTQANGDRALGFYFKGRSEVGLKWYREAKASFEAASKLAPANQEISSFIEHVSGMLGEGSNSSIKDPIDPVAIPASLTNSPIPPSRPDYAKDYGAYYSRRVVAVSWKPGKEHKRTEFMIGHVLDVSGVTAFSTLQIPFDPLSEQIYVNELRVMDRTGKTLALGKPSDYYVLDDRARHGATQKKLLNIPVPGLEPGCQISLTFTSREPGGQDEFPFLEHCFSRHLPVCESILYLSGETAGLKQRSSPVLEPEKLANGLCWRFSDPGVARWEPLQPSAASFLPMLWIADGAARWPALATNYLSQIADRLEVEPGVLDLAKTLTARCQSDETKTETLTRHVQTNLTYKAIEFGRRARIPSKPSEIVWNKYGDCKDHAVLLQQMLKSAGVPAELALVSHHGLVQRDLPSLDQFDHMIVYLPGKAERFIDCTDKGADAAHQIPLGLAGHQALILDPKNPRFAAVPTYSETASRIGIKRHLTPLNRVDVEIDETLTLTGVHAAYMRDFMVQLPASSRRSYFQRQMGLTDAEFLDFEVQALEKPEMPLQVHCLYRVKKQFHSAGPRLSGVLRASMERAYLAADPVDKRLSPFEIVIPVLFKSSVTIDVPGGFLAEQSAEFRSKLDGRFADAEGHCQIGAGQLNIEFECRQASGNFRAADYAAYRDSMGQVLALLEREVSFKVVKN